MEQYRLAWALMTEASDLMETLGDTLIAAQISTPLATIEDRIHANGDVAGQGGPLGE